MVQDLIRELNGLVYGLFGAAGLRWFQEHPLLYLLALLVPAAAFAYWMLRRLRRALARWIRVILLRLHLMRWRQGRQGLRLARAIRQGSRRLRRVLRSGAAEKGQHQALLELLDRFVREDLNDALERLRHMLAADRHPPGRPLRRRLEAQTARWAELPEGETRDGLQRDIAATRQRLAQIDRLAANRARLLESLEEAASALRNMESELAALHPWRAGALPDLRDRLVEAAEGLRFEREAHLELEVGP